MKKIVVILLALVMVVSFTACADGGTPAETTKAAATTTAVPGDTVADTTATITTPATTTTAKVTTTAEPVTTAKPVEIPVVPTGAMVYYQDFNGFANTEGNDAVMSLIGWKIRNVADGALNDNTGVFSIENGTLGFKNYDGGNITGKDSYVQMLDSDYMIAAAHGDYTLQYDVKYTAAGNSERYIVILLNYDGYNSYNSFHLRIAGSANNQIRFIGSWYTYDVAGEFYAADKADGDGTSTVFNKLTGQTYSTSAPFGLTDLWITVKYQANYNDGPTVYLRNNSQPNAQFVCVSKPDTGSTGYLYWNMIEAYGVALKLGTTIDGYLDNVAIWTGLGEMPTDKTTTAYEAAIAGYLAEIKK